MSKPITTIITIPDMIKPADWLALSEKSEVEYIETGKKIGEEELLKLITKSDYLMLDPDAVGELNESFYKQVKERKLPLRAISADITGMSWAHPEAAKKYGIPLMNTANYSTVSVAEFTVALLLMRVKKMDAVWSDRAKGKPEKAYKNDVLAGKTIGIIGLGNIGTKVAEFLKAFDMHIIAWDRKDKQISGVQQLVLEEVLKQADFLSIHLKTTEETKGMFDKELLSHAKKGQFIINEADGPLVDNDALLAVISSGQVDGYACSSEAVAGAPLAGHENVITFPPQAWFTDHSLKLLREIWTGNILSAISGKLQNEVE